MFKKDSEKSSYCKEMVSQRATKNRILIFVLYRRKENRILAGDSLLLIQVTVKCSSVQPDQGDFELWWEAKEA